jgi:hypothetical protein
MEMVNCNIEVIGNMIKITPVGDFKDNSIYKIRLKDIKELGGLHVLESGEVEFCTAVSPAYTSLDAVKVLTETCNLKDTNIMYHIREASKTADFYKAAAKMMKIDINSIPFEVEQFAKYKAAHECVLRFYIEMATKNISKGALGDVNFETNIKLPDISKLLVELDEQVDFWQSAMLGYEYIAPAKPKATLRGYKAIVPPVMTPLNTDYNRGV